MIHISKKMNKRSRKWQKLYKEGQRLREMYNLVPLIHGEMASDDLERAIDDQEQRVLKARAKVDPWE